MAQHRVAQQEGTPGHAAITSWLVATQLRCHHPSPGDAPCAEPPQTIPIWRLIKVGLSLPPSHLNPRVFHRGF